MAGEWIETTVGEAFEIGPSRTLKRGDVAPFIPMDALPVHARAFERIDHREFTGSGTRFKNGDTLIARITPCLENGKTAYVAGLPDSSVGHGSTEYIVLAGRESLSDGLYGYYLARSPDFRRYAIGHMEGTSGRQRVPSTAIEKYILALPPLPEQRAIAHILGTLDDKIELTRRRNQTLEAMARALFKDWFVDFGPVRAKLQNREPYLPADLWQLFPDRLDDEGKPEGWDERPLDEVADFLNGLALQKFPASDPDDSLPVIKIAELRNGISAKSDRASRDVPAKYVIKDGDFLFSWSGSLLAKFWTEGEGALNQHLFKVTSERYPMWFVSHWVHHHLEEFQAIAASKATTMGHIQRGHLKAAMTICPPDDVLERMGIVMAPLVEQAIQNELESRNLAQLRDTLMPKLISGELRIADAENLLEDVV